MKPLQFQPLKNIFLVRIEYQKSENIFHFIFTIAIDITSIVIIFNYHLLLPNLLPVLKVGYWTFCTNGLNFYSTTYMCQSLFKPALNKPLSTYLVYFWSKFSISMTDTGEFLNRIALLILCSTGKSLSEVLLFSEHGENMLCTKIVLNVGNNFCTQHVLFSPGLSLEFSCIELIIK